MLRVATRSSGRRLAAVTPEVMARRVHVRGKFDGAFDFPRPQVATLGNGASHGIFVIPAGTSLGGGFGTTGAVRAGGAPRRTSSVLG